MNVLVVYMHTSIENRFIKNSWLKTQAATLMANPVYNVYEYNRLCIHILAESLTVSENIKHYFDPQIKIAKVRMESQYQIYCSNGATVDQLKHQDFITSHLEKLLGPKVDAISLKGHKLYLYKMSEETSKDLSRQRLILDLQK